ncbi:MAG: hypothetical protein ACJAZ9_001270 [Neolewinella sp.]|jgi:hypothetical protein
MPSPKFENKQGVSQPKLVQKPRAPVPVPDERDRLRDIIVVIITYPLTPSTRASKFGNRNQWLEVLSLVLKAALAGYAIYKGVAPSSW